MDLWFLLWSSVRSGVVFAAYVGQPCCFPDQFRGRLRFDESQDQIRDRSDRPFKFAVDFSRGMLCGEYETPEGSTELAFCADMSQSRPGRKQLTYIVEENFEAVLQGADFRSSQRQVHARNIRGLHWIDGAAKERTQVWTEAPPDYQIDEIRHRESRLSDRRWWKLCPDQGLQSWSEVRLLWHRWRCRWVWKSCLLVRPKLWWHRWPVSKSSPHRWRLPLPPRHVLPVPQPTGAVLRSENVAGYRQQVDRLPGTERRPGQADHSGSPALRRSHPGEGCRHLADMDRRNSDIEHDLSLDIRVDPDDLPGRQGGVPRDLHRHERHGHELSDHGQLHIGQGNLWGHGQLRRFVQFYSVGYLAISGEFQQCQRNQWQVDGIPNNYYLNTILNIFWLQFLIPAASGV